LPRHSTITVSPHPVINDNNTIIKKWTPILVNSKRPLKKKDHPNHFTIDDDSDPIEHSIQYLLSAYSESNDLVVDPFLGNGEVLRVSKELKRRFIGIDADSVRVKIAKGLSLG
jgi:DNA modification methylase